jgi:hypothetical protein
VDGEAAVLAVTVDGGALETAGRVIGADGWRPRVRMAPKVISAAMTIVARKHLLLSATPAMRMMRNRPGRLVSAALFLRRH